MNVVALIPAYNPDQRLSHLAGKLVAAGFAHVVIVNDGSCARSVPVFEQVRRWPECTVLEHAENLGKGRALKSGLQHIHDRMAGVIGVVTADADGQHLPRDVEHVARTLERYPNQLILGSRDFKGSVPRRSAFGNQITRALFAAVVGRRLHDTQTGLRGIPRSLIPAFLAVAGDRYEYEMNVLVACKVHGVPVREEQIATVYLDGNRSSHFRPLVDSMTIYAVLLRFAVSSLIASTVDMLLFSVLFIARQEMVGAAVFARLLSSLLYLYLKKEFVFHLHKVAIDILVKYFAFVVIMAITAYGLVIATVHISGLEVVVAKVLVECLLFWISFVVQRDVIFHPTPYPGRHSPAGGAAT